MFYVVISNRYVYQCIDRFVFMIFKLLYNRGNFREGKFIIDF